MILKLFVINQCQAAQAPPLETILNSYANVFIAIFTAAAVLIAALQFREAIRGANMKLLFADNALAFIGPANLDDIERAIFFSLALVVVNEGPKVGTITNLRLKMLFPDPQTMIKRGAMEDAYSFSFRFESEEATNAPVPAFSVNGNSSEIIRVRCAITKQNVLPGNLRPPVADLLLRQSEDWSKLC